MIRAPFERRSIVFRKYFCRHKSAKVFSENVDLFSGIKKCRNPNHSVRVCSEIGD